jgi:F-type H+-transporting ATPase subunit alpha
VVSIFAGVRGFLDTIKVEDINRFEAAFLNDVRAKHADVLEAIRKEKELSKATEEKLNSILGAFVKSFA